MLVKLNIQTLPLLALILIFLSSSCSRLFSFSLFRCCLVLSRCRRLSIGVSHLFSFFLLSRSPFPFSLPSFLPSYSRSLRLPFCMLFILWSVTHSFSLTRIPAFCRHHLSCVSSSPYLATNMSYLVSRRRNACEVVMASQRLCFMFENMLSEN